MAEAAQALHCKVCCLQLQPNELVWLILIDLYTELIKCVKCACRLCRIFLIRQEKDLTNWLVFLPWNFETETVSQAWALKLHTHPHEFQWASVSTLRSLKCAKRKQKSAYVSLLPKWKTGLQNVKTKNITNTYIYISSSRFSRDLDNSCKAACTGWISTNRRGPPTKCQAGQNLIMGHH